MMPKRSNVNVIVKYCIIPDEEFKKILIKITDWYVDAFMRQFVGYLNQLSIEKQKANGEENINEHVFDNCFR